VPPPLDKAAAFGIGYRAMTDGDLPFVAALYATTRAEEVAATGWPPALQASFLDQQHRAQHAHYRAAHPDGEWLLIERAGQPVGRLYLAEQDGVLVIVDISLLPAQRGAGLGTAILTDLLSSESRPVRLHVERHNPAQRLYARLGFSVVEDGPVYFRMVRPARSAA
jgi:ribosomal protein S18 acetylase RimI-like enzyme